MRRRPRVMLYLSLLFGALALAIPLQAMVIYGHDWHELSTALAKLTELNWLVVGSLLCGAVLLWQASPHIRWFVPLVIGLVAINNFVVGYYATDFSATLTLLATLGFALMNLPLLHPDSINVFLHPERRWWMRAERHRLAIPVAIEGTRLASLRAETYDLSETGAFIPQVRNIGVGDWITVRMTFGALTQIRCQGRVVRRTEARGIYPAGVGIRFEGVSWRQRRELRKCLTRHLEL